MNARGFRSMTVTLLLLAASVAIMAASATHSGTAQSQPKSVPHAQR